MFIPHKLVFTGLEGSGKSLKMAEYLYYILSNNAYYLKKTGIPRPIYTNTPLSSDFVSLAKSKGIPIISWKNLSEIDGLTGCDIVIDELGTYFDSRLWSELPHSVRLWLSQCNKNGVNIIGTAQDFAQVDKSFRRLTSKLYYVTKIIGSRRPHKTLPPVRFPFGLFMMRDINPRCYREDEPKIDQSGLPHFFTLKKRYFSIFDTNATIPKSEPLPFKHIERFCSVCGFKKVIHS